MKSHLPGALDLTLGTTAAVLRGIWEIVATYGSRELEIDVYVGRQDAAHYQGSCALYTTASTREVA